MFISKFSDKKPSELTEEELFELVNEIAVIQYTRRNDIQKVKSKDDVVQDVMTLAYSKAHRNTKNIVDCRDYTMRHFVNIIFFEVNNSINMYVRKPEVRNFIHNTISADVLSFNTSDVDEEKDVFSDGTADIHTLASESLLLSAIDDTEDESTIIRVNYGDKVEEYNYSHRRMAKLYLDFNEGKKLRSNILEGMLVNGETGLLLNKRQIREKMKVFSDYIINSDVLGGVC